MVCSNLLVLDTISRPLPTIPDHSSGQLNWLQVTNPPSIGDVGDKIEPMERKDNGSSFQIISKMLLGFQIVLDI